jgi:large subunit ribosomal protein L25
MTHAEITPTLTVTLRGDIKTKALRREGLVPMELYGHGKDNRHLVAPVKDVTKLYRTFGETTLIEVIEGENKVKVLFTEAQIHPMTHNLVHLDLHAVNLKEKVTAQVPISFVGVSPAVDGLGGTLIESKQEVEVECLPTDLPHELEVDITSLATFDDVLRISDITLPAGVELISEPDEVIASVQEPRSEEELAALDEKIEEVDVEEAVAVEEKGKDDEPAADAE